MCVGRELGEDVVFFEEKLHPLLKINLNDKSSPFVSFDVANFRRIAVFLDKLTRWNSICGRLFTAISKLQF